MQPQNYEYLRVKSNPTLPRGFTEGDNRRVRLPNIHYSPAELGRKKQRINLDDNEQPDYDLDHLLLSEPFETIPLRRSSNTLTPVYKGIVKQHTFQNYNSEKPEALNFPRIDDRQSRLSQSSSRYMPSSVSAMQSQSPSDKRLALLFRNSLMK